MSSDTHNPDYNPMENLYGLGVGYQGARQLFSKSIGLFDDTEETKLTIKTSEVAREFNVDSSTVRLWRLSGRIKGIKYKGTWFFDLKSLRDVFLSESTRRFKGIKHNRWSKEEEEELINTGQCKTRSLMACYIKKNKIEKNGRMSLHVK